LLDGSRTYFDVVIDTEERLLLLASLRIPLIFVVVVTPIAIVLVV
jgi:hypothetical protein